ncbi:hypothetical protein ACRQ1B_13585 [Rhizobium panacihumi]|uniref:hypothetical protein n=1 Tax=Rhizobium panacihumi TaxID=2008450 RepID=UPI003D7B875D
MTPSSWVFKGLLAFVGAVAAGYVFEDVFGGDGAVAWIVSGAILGVTVGPLFQSLLAWRKERDAARAATKEKGGNA